MWIFSMVLGRAALGVQPWGLQRAALGVQRAALGVQRAALGVQRAACSVQPWACSARACSVQRTLYALPTRAYWRLQR